MTTTERELAASDSVTASPVKAGVTRPAGQLARFVAYDRTAVRAADPEGGTARTVRSETWVQEYSSILVASIEEKSTGTYDSLYVKFDIKSANVGMNHNVGANTVPNSPVAQRLQAAHKAGTPVYVALETWRKPVSADKVQISRLTPIHTLRGVTGDGVSGNAQVTKANCVNVIGAVGDPNNPNATDYADSDLRSDPTEWSQLRDNQLGGLAPQGWRYIMAEGKRTGAITPDIGGDSVGIGALSNIDEFVDAFDKRLVERGVIPAPERGAVRRVRATEAKPWEPVNTDGRPNAGSFMAARYREAWVTATVLIGAALNASEQRTVNADQIEAHTNALTQGILWCTGRAQVAVTGRGDASANSFREAMEWVRIAATSHPLPLNIESDVESVESKAALNHWVVAVKDSATVRFQAAYAWIANTLFIDLNAAAPSQPEEPSPPPDNAHTDQPQLPSGAVTNTVPVHEGDQPGTTSQTAELAQAWLALADKIGMRNHMRNLRPIVRATFKVVDGYIREVDPAALKAQIALWEADINAFEAAAKAAFDNQS